MKTTVYIILLIFAESSLLHADDSAFIIPDSIITNSSFMPMTLGDRLIAFPLWPEQTENARVRSVDEKLYNRDLEQNQFGLNRAIENVSYGSALVFPVKSEKPTPAVLIFPGGGFVKVTIDKEGIDVAQWLNANDITAVVVKYRTVPSDAREGWSYRDSNALYNSFYADARQAIRIVHSKANEFNIDPDKIGVMGFSAGGRLAAHVLVESGIENLYDERSETSHPTVSFACLIYPVITENLVQLINRNTPPAFICNCRDDRAAPAADAEEFYDTLKKNGIESEAHFYDTGGHGFGLGVNGGTVTQWPNLFLHWLEKLD